MACGSRAEMFDSFQSQLASCPLEGEVKAKRVRGWHPLLRAVNAPACSRG
jgi:hypothetical protein